MRRFEGKTIVVTGSGRDKGLGQAILRRFADEGANCVVSDLGRPAEHMGAGDIGTTDEMEAVAEDLRGRGARVAVVPCDVRSEESCAALADAATGAFGSLDIWVNNAGIGYIVKPLLDVTEAEWRAVIDVNLTGAFYGVQAAAQRMVAAKKGGRIINVASQAAKSGFPNMQAYTSSKHGLVGLVRSAATELGEHGITVNNVCPNHVTTGLGAWQNEYFAARQRKTIEQYLKDMAARIPMGRPGLPQDTANAVAFLCQDAAGYITAESLNVSGGEEPH